MPPAHCHHAIHHRAASARALVSAIVLALVAASCSGPSREAASIGAVGAASRPAATAGPATTSTPAPATTTTTTEPATTTTIVPLPIGASRFVSAVPSRVYDSRSAEGSKLRAGDEHVIDLSGRGGVPYEGVTAVAVNVTAIDAAGAGDVTVWAEGDARPAGPSVELAGRGDTVAKLVVVRVSPRGQVRIAATTAVDLAMDVSGWFEAVPDAGSADGRFLPLPPSRVIDSTTSLGAPGPLPAGGLVSVAVAGPGTAVPADASAVALQVSVFDASPPGFVTVWPAGAARPATSDLNAPPAGWTATNVVLARPGVGGRITVQTSAASGLTVDVVGWFTGGASAVDRVGLFVPATARAFDTADANGGGLIEPRFRRDVPIAALPDAPRLPIAATFVNVTALQPDDTGTVNVYPAGTARAAAISLPVQGAAVTSNATAIVRLGEGGALSLFTEQRTGLTVDVLGYVLGASTQTDPLVPPHAPGPDGTPPMRGLDDAVSSFLREHGLTGASVAIAKDGRVVATRAYGVMGEADPTPTRVDSLFRYASMSKPITAAAVLQLAQAGGLSLDQPALAILAKRVLIPAGADPRLRQITVRQLLQHVSGLNEKIDPFFNDQPGVREAFGPTGPSSCVDAARWFVGLPMAADPGTRFAYVNMNYCLLSLIIEAITKQPYDQAVQDLVLSPRGIHDAVLGHSQSPAPGEVAHRTQPADQSGGGHFMESLLGAGAWVGTAVDLVRFLDGFDPTKPGYHLLQPQLFAHLLDPPPGREPGGITWGLGVEVFGPDTFGHTGSLAGARGMMQHRADGITWAILVNGTFANHGAVLQALMNRAIGSITSWPTYDYSPDLP